MVSSIIVCLERSMPFIGKEVDILGPRTVTLPSTYGQALAPENYAERSWRGGELALTWMDKAANGEITYSAYLNLGFARDRWDVLDEDATYREGGNLHALSKLGKAEGILTGLIADHLLTDPAEVEALKAKGFKQFGRDPIWVVSCIRIREVMATRRDQTDGLIAMMSIIC